MLTARKAAARKAGSPSERRSTNGRSAPKKQKGSTGTAESRWAPEVLTAVHNTRTATQVSATMMRVIRIFRTLRW
jgi:hypothetical protein